MENVAFKKNSGLLTTIANSLTLWISSSLIYFACSVVAPPRLFTPLAKWIIKNIHLCCWSYLVSSCWHQWGVWTIIQHGRKPYCGSQEHHSFTDYGASQVIALFIYFAMSVICEINRHHHKASKLALICVPWTSELFGKTSDFSNIEF